MSTFGQRPDTSFDIAKRDSVRMQGKRYISKLFAQRFSYMLIAASEDSKRQLAGISSERRRDIVYHIRANKHIRERRNAKYKFTIIGFAKTLCQI